MDLVKSIKAIAALDKALSPVIDNALINALEKNPDQTIETLKGIAQPLASALGYGLVSMGFITPQPDNNEVDDDDDPDFDPMEDDDDDAINPEYLDPDDNDSQYLGTVDAQITGRVIQFLRNVQVALGLDYNDTYKLLLLMGVEDIIPEAEHNYLTARFNEFF